MKMKRILSLFLSLILIFSICSNVFVVFGEDTAPASSERRKNFLNFTQYKDELDLNMNSLTTNDYFTMMSFMSNWFTPGVTTLEEVQKAEGEYFTQFSKFFGLEGNANLKGIVEGFGADVVNGINSGVCTIVDDTGKPVNGKGFLNVILNTINDDTVGEELKNQDVLNVSKLYFGVKGKIAFDFSSDAMKAAFQTIFAVNPDLFISDKGIQSLDVFYIDAIGNLWGATTESLPDNYDLNTEFKNGNSLNATKLSSVYLILPSCLNPSVFTPNVKDSSSQNELRMPLMNRFTLSAIIDSVGKLDLDSDNDFINAFIPIYNVLANTGSSSSNNALNIIGLNTLSPYTLNTGKITSDTWSSYQRTKAFADFIYNPKSFSIDGANSDKGRVKYDSYSYIVFSMDPTAISYLKNAEGSSVIDMSQGFFSIFGKGDLAMTVFQDEDKASLLQKQKKLMMYFFTPTLLDLNKVSMNCYKIPSSQFNPDNEEMDASSQFGSWLSSNTEIEVNEVSIQDSALTSAAVSKLGLTGLSLYLDDIQITKPEGENNKYYVTPRNISNSKLVETLLEGIDTHNETIYKNLKQGGLLDNDFHDLANFLFKKQTNNKNLEDIDDLNNALQKIDSDYTLYDGDGKSKTNLTFSSTNNTEMFLKLNTKTVLNMGEKNKDITLGRLIGLNDTPLKEVIKATTNGLMNDAGTVKITVTKDNITDYIIGLYGYSVFFPSDLYSEIMTFQNSWDEISVFGNTEMINSKTCLGIGNFSGDFMAGMYLAYIVDMMGLGTCDVQAGLTFGSFSSPFLPKYNISAKGGTLSLSGVINGATGVEKSEDLSFEQKQKDLINRIYGLTNDSNNDYRNNLIKNILEGFILTVHRTITGTWGSNISTVSTGSSSTYQSVTGYIYTPTLEELSFTATLMNNYIKVYIICMIIIIFMLVLMVFLHMRTWQQGLIIGLTMFVALLFPYLLISNTINISNKISNNIYSDRFDFWALTEHYQSRVSLQGSEFMNEYDKWLAEGSATNDTTLIGQSGVKIKWMSPKKVDEFQNLYSDSSYSQNFATNLGIFKWLFSSFIYDSEFVDTDVMGSFVYRPYKTIAIEAETYCAWGKDLAEKNGILDIVSNNLNYNDNTLSVSKGFKTMLDTLNSEDIDKFIGGIARQDSLYYTNGKNKIIYTDDKLEDILKIRQFNLDTSANLNEKSEKVGLWGLLSTEVSTVIKDNDVTNVENPGIYSNLPISSSDTNAFENSEPDVISKAIYLKNTESPFYYFYSVLKFRYGDGVSPGQEFRKALLNNNIFKVKETEESPLNLHTNKRIINSYRDFLDLEGLFEYVIPYLHLGNTYVANWQKVNGSDIEQYNFNYKVYNEKEAKELSKEAGTVKKDDTLGEDSKGTLGAYKPEDSNERGSVTEEYSKAVTRKNAMNRVWNMYSPWVDALYDTNVFSKKVTVGGSKVLISDTLNPSSYILQGRPMIFSEADMIIKGYAYKDLTDVERKIQAVTEKTYEDLLYLVNYYDMDDEVLLCAAAMYATFNFNSEFSKDSFLGESIMLYPQGFELKNFNYDAFMRLALLNSTGETVFATADLYERVLAKTSVFTGLLLLICDLVACIAIPMFKFVILVGLLFLGILICIACVVNPPEKIFEAVNKSLLLPTVLFMALNIAFAWVMSLIVGEGLTAYVGSKTVNFATNDPTITMLIMALLGVAYLFCAWKILKFLIAAYKQFGMGTALAAVGIVGAAIAAGTSGVAKKASRITGGAVGAGIGAATAGKGNRLSGAMEGAGAGTKGIVGRRLNEKRMVKALSGGLSGNKQTTDKINDLASSSGSGPNTSGSNSGKSSSSTPPGKAPTQKEESKTPPTPPSELDRDMTNVTDKKANKLGRALGGLSYTKAKVADKFDAVKSGFKKTGYVVSNLPDVARYGRDKASAKVTSKIDKASSYMGSALKTYRDENDFNRYRNSERSRERSERQQTFEQKVSDKATIDRNIKMMNKKRQVG